MPTMDMPFVDIHSHLLPGIDDGVSSVEESLDILKSFASLGYKKVVTTPHIMEGVYPNTPIIIREQLKKVKEAIKIENIDIQLEAAAEYYLDEYFIQTLDSDEELLSFGENYVLFETAFMNLPIQLKEVIFKLKSRGYQPVYAHPERYAYLHNDFELLEELVHMGALLQININSLAGYYSKTVKKMAEKIIDQKMNSFLGSDCHNMNHFEVFAKTLEKKYFHKAVENGLLNNSI